MIEVVDLWVCPNCNILHGIETKYNQSANKLETNCVSCGVSLSPSDVHFLDPQLVKTVHQKISSILPDIKEDEIRFSWVSHKTVGIIFEVDPEDVEDSLEGEFDDFIDQFEREIGISITVYYE